MHYTLTKRGRTWPKDLTYWLAELLEPTENLVKLSKEHQDFKWLPLQEAKDICGFNDFIEALDKCHGIITKDCKYTNFSHDNFILLNKFWMRI